MGGAIPARVVAPRARQQHGAVQADVAAIGQQRMLRQPRHRKTHRRGHSELVQVEAVCNHRQSVVRGVTLGQHAGHTGRGCRQQVAQHHVEAFARRRTHDQRLDGAPGRKLLAQRAQRLIRRPARRDSFKLVAGIAVTTLAGIGHVHDRLRIADLMTTVVDDALGAGRIAIAREIAGTHHVDLEKAPRRIFFTHLAHLIGQIAARHGLGRPDGCESSRPDARTYRTSVGSPGAQPGQRLVQPRHVPAAPSPNDAGLEQLPRWLRGWKCGAIQR